MNINIMHGDCRLVLNSLPEKSVQTVVTSPPYWGQRDYDTAEFQGGDPDCDHVPTDEWIFNKTQTARGAIGATDKAMRAAATARWLEKGKCPRCGAIKTETGIGLEAEVSGWVDEMVNVFRKVRRVLRDDGTVWLNLGDKYNGSGSPGNLDGKQRTNRGTYTQKHTMEASLKKKDLIGLPWRTAFALQADGWYLRADIIWHKPNPMPQSMTDRPSVGHEYVFLLTKMPRYFYDHIAVRTPLARSSVQRLSQDTFDDQTGGAKDYAGDHGNDNSARKTIENMREKFIAQKAQGDRHQGWKDRDPETGANLRTVWTIPTQPFSGEHYATFPEKLADTCIAAGTSIVGECPECGSPWVRVTERQDKRHWSERRAADGPKTKPGLAHGRNDNGRDFAGDDSKTLEWAPSCEHTADPVPQTVLDPFNGAATTGLVAAKSGRSYIGIELNPDYVKISEDRIEQYRREQLEATGADSIDEVPEDMEVQARMTF